MANPIELKKSINVSIEQDDEFFVIYYKPLNLFGYGNNIKEAADDFWVTLVDHYKFLKENKNSLGIQLKKDLIHYKEIFK